MEVAELTGLHAALTRVIAASQQALGTSAR
jgi:hypothetical protein